MKQIICVFAVLIMIVTCTYYSKAESLNHETLLFREIPWDTPLCSVRETIESVEGVESWWTGALTEHTRITGWDGTYYKDSAYFVKDGGATLSYTAPIAGYNNIALTLSFLYPIDNASINSHTNSAQFVKATYTFNDDDVESLDATYVDLRNKLSDLYGDGSEVQEEPNLFTGICVLTSTTWISSDNSLIFLYISRDSLSGVAKKVRLIYAVGDLHERITALNNLMKEGIIPEDHTVIIDPTNHDGL